MATYDGVIPIVKQFYVGLSIPAASALEARAWALSVIDPINTYTKFSSRVVDIFEEENV
jgi:hypothetical protein